MGNIYCSLLSVFVLHWLQTSRCEVLYPLTLWHLVVVQSPLTNTLWSDTTTKFLFADEPIFPIIPKQQHLFNKWTPKTIIFSSGHKSLRQSLQCQPQGKEFTTHRTIVDKKQRNWKIFPLLNKSCVFLVRICLSRSRFVFFFHFDENNRIQLLCGAIHDHETRNLMRWLFSLSSQIDSNSNFDFQLEKGNWLERITLRNQFPDLFQTRRGVCVALLVITFKMKTCQLRTTRLSGSCNGTKLFKKALFCVSFRTLPLCLLATISCGDLSKREALFVYHFRQPGP